MIMLMVWGWMGVMRQRRLGIVIVLIVRSHQGGMMMLLRMRMLLRMLLKILRLGMMLRGLPLLIEAPARIMDRRRNVRSPLLLL
jgi:hypothetical protein